MLDKLPFRARLLRLEEMNLLAVLIKHSGKPIGVTSGDGIYVEDLNDGGMGSIRFLNTNSDGVQFGQIISEAEYVDSDGVLVSIALNTDNRGNWYELDFWKIDFSPLRTYPRAEQLRLK